MNQARHLKLGTRRSLLAWAQSSWVARRIEELNPGVTVELVGIDTRGDRILDVSLQQVQGKEFFVAELDQALHEGRVDLTVHSMKDLSLERPAEFTLAAIPKRENPRDVVLFGPGVMDKLRAGKPLRIGTSSPRRLENIPDFLERVLPRVGTSAPKVEFIDIRGNVNTRLSRVQEPENSPKHLDAVVLAFAGLIRLWADPAGRDELRKLLDGVRWMILPLRECPAAPAQGALAVECRANDSEVRAFLSKLHDSPTATQVGRERQLLADWGGGCHQKFGATAISHPEAGDLMFVRGKRPDGVFVEELRWNQPVMGSAASPWDGSRWRIDASEKIEAGIPLLEEAVFVAHSRALPAEWSSRLEKARVWTSGVASWEKLGKLGVWVEGCADGLGHAHVETVLSEAILQLPERERWIVLTHRDAAEGWNGSQVIATYQIHGQYSDEARASLRGATHIFWSSGSQFDALKGELGGHPVHHACGPGKTASHLRENGIEPVVFPSAEEWRQWAGTSVSAQA